MAQNNYIEECIRKHGRALDYKLRISKKEARKEHLHSREAKRLHGWRAIMMHKKNRHNKVQLQKEKKIKEKSAGKTKIEYVDPLPILLLDRDEYINPEIKNKKQKVQKANKYSVPISKVGGVADAQTFTVLKTGKRRSKQWKRVVNRPCFVGADFTRKNPKYERFIRPIAMRFSSCHVTNPDTKRTHNLPILGVKESPHGELHNNLGILTRGTIIEVNVSELGILKGGKIVWGKYAQITNNPENDGCINAVLLI